MQTRTNQAEQRRRHATIDADEAVRRAILAAFADRVARRRDATGRRAVMVGGRGVRLHERSAVREAPLFVCVDLQELGQSESLVRQASAIERDWLPADLITTTIDVEFDPERKRIVAFRRTRYLDLVLDEAATNVPTDFDASPLLAKAAAEQLDANFLQDEAGLQYLARVRSLAVWMPELKLPDFGDDPIRALLMPLCRGCRSIDEVRRVRDQAGRSSIADAGANPGGRPRSAGTIAGSQRQPNHVAIRSRAAAGAGGAHSGSVRHERDAARGGGTRAGADAFVGPEHAAAAGDGRLGKFLEYHLCRGSQRASPPLSETRLARGSAGRSTAAPAGAQVVEEMARTRTLLCTGGIFTNSATVLLRRNFHKFRYGEDRGDAAARVLY